MAAANRSDGERAIRILAAGAGAIAGISSALIVAFLGTPGIGMSVVVGALLGVPRMRRVLLAGYFASLGATWIGLLLRATLNCSVHQTVQGCEQPALLPFLLVAAAAFAIGIALAFLESQSRNPGA